MHFSDRVVQNERSNISTILKPPIKHCRKILSKPRITLAEGWVNQGEPLHKAR